VMTLDGMLHPSGSAAPRRFYASNDPCITRAGSISILLGRLRGSFASAHAVERSMSRAADGTTWVPCNSRAPGFSATPGGAVGRAATRQLTTAAIAQADSTTGARVLNSVGRVPTCPSTSPFAGRNQQRVEVRGKPGDSPRPPRRSDDAVACQTST
jgi:hypothetical protein